MAAIARCGVAVLVLFAAAAGSAAENNAAVKDAIETLLTRLDKIGHDPDMTTAKKAIVAADVMEKFNQQYKGKPLTVRLKIQDVVPAAKGQYLTASNPDLSGVQLRTAKFQTSLSSAEVMSVSKESVLAVTGLVSAGSPTQTQPRLRSDTLTPGSNIAFPLRANPACQLALDNISYRLEVAPATATPLLATGKTTGSSTVTDKTKNEQTRRVDDIKLFFLKGILQAQRQSGTTNPAAPGTTGTGQTYGSNVRSGSGYGSYGSNTATTPPYGTVKHNRIYTAAEIIQKFGEPSSRSSTATAENWAFKCKDGVVHVHFTQVGFSRSSSATRSETLKLEIKSVDSTSTSNR